MTCPHLRRQKGIFLFPELPAAFHFDGLIVADVNWGTSLSKRLQLNTSKVISQHTL